jgi:hypothetical protein
MVMMMDPFDWMLWVIPSSSVRLGIVEGGGAVSTIALDALVAK